jgi:WhiB family redox-sensing transcriptional regulator
MVTATEGCVNSPSRQSAQPARPNPPFDELVSALACTSSPEWDVASCRRLTGAAISLFFSDDIADINQAKSICADCPLASRCLQGALDRHEPCGVWGGYLFANGQVLAHKRPRGRPPKHRPAQDIRQLSPARPTRGGASRTSAP